MNKKQHPNSLLILVFVFATILSGSLRAGIRPSFNLEYNTWNATDIVIATEGEEIDGQLRVLKVLVGSLKQGDAISIPELGQFLSKESRTVSRFWHGANDKAAPHVLTGGNLILFLKRDGGRADVNLVWKPASRFGGMKVSFVWIDKGQVYGFTQVINPGSAVLADQRLTEKKFKQKVLTIIKARKALLACSALHDTKDRAKTAAAFVYSPNYSVHKEAFSLLSGCGDDALPYLRLVLGNQDKRHLHDVAVEALGIAGGVAAVPELTKMVENELLFWEKTAPGLDQGWWNNMSDERTGLLRERYSFVLEVFYTLKRLKSPACKTAVTEFRNYWRAFPQLEDKSGLNQMSRACDEVLRALPRKN